MSDIIGVIWGANIIYDGQGGYGLAILKDAIIVGRKSGWRDGFEGYVGSGGTNQNVRLANRTRQAAEELIQAKQLELPKDSITKIGYKKAGIYSRGHLTIHTVTQEYRFDIPFSAGATAVWHTAQTLVRSLNDFAPDRFYDEETGHLMVDPKEGS